MTTYPLPATPPALCPFASSALCSAEDTAQPSLFSTDCTSLHPLAADATPASLISRPLIPLSHGSGSEGRTGAAGKITTMLGAVVPAPAAMVWQTVHEAACALHAAQMNVFPVQPVSKEPYGRHGFLTATRLSADDLPTLMAGSNLAVMTGRLSQFLFVLDCDDVVSFTNIGRELAKRGIRAWIRNSVRGGQYWLLSADGEIANAKLGKVDVLGNRKYTLAPPSIHPSKMVYEWIDRSGDLPPLVTLADLDFLPLRLNRVTKQMPPHDGKTVLPPVAHTVLALQDAGRYNADHSAAEFAACLSLLGAGYDADHIIRLFHAFAPQHFSRVGEADFRRAVLSKACAYREQGDREVRSTAPVHSSVFIAWAESAAWPGRTGNTDKAVFLAMCQRMQCEGGMPFHASVRELAERANVHTETAHKAIHRLVATGLAALAGSDQQTDAHRYTLYLPQLAENVNRTLPPTGGVGKPTVRFMNSDHDAWNAKALGKSALYVYTNLRERGEMTVPEIAQATGKARPTVRRALANLEKWKMVWQEGRRWQATDVTGDVMDRIAERCSTLGRTDLRGERHQAEREHRASAIIRKQKWRWEAQQARQTIQRSAPSR